MQRYSDMETWGHSRNFKEVLTLFHPSQLNASKHQCKQSHCHATPRAVSLCTMKLRLKQANRQPWNSSAWLHDAKNQVMATIAGAKSILRERLDEESEPMLYRVISKLVMHISAKSVASLNLHVKLPGINTSACKDCSPSDFLGCSLRQREDMT